MEFPRRLHVETDGTQFEGHWLQGPSPLFCQPRHLRVRLGPRGDPAGIGRKLGHQLSTQSRLRERHFASRKEANAAWRSASSVAG